MTPPFTAERIYQHFQQEIEKYLKARVSCVAQREDLMQDFYLRLMRVNHWHKIDNIGGYVQTIINNLVLDNYRQLGHNYCEELIAETVVSPDCFETSLINKQTLAQMQRLIEKQSSEKKDLLWRAKIEGQNYQQIAADKKRSVSWVEKSIARLVQQCKQVALREH